MTKKKISLGIGLLIVALLSWYLFLKTSDYTISFTAKTATGTVFQGIKDWSAVGNKKQKAQYRIVDKQNFTYLKQSFVGDTIHMEYTWNIEAINDSMTEVKVDIKDLNHSLYNRLTVPFSTTAFKTEQLQKIKVFRDGLMTHLNDFKIKIEGKGRTEAVYVAYITLKSVQAEKAQTMIGNDAVITGFLSSNHIKITGKPYLEVLNWDVDGEKLDFNYCFPIDKNTKSAGTEQVKFKTIPAQEGLKATYYGNYRTSDRAWYSLLDYAKRYHFEVQDKPLENFMNNPFNGGEELQWETKILLPFSKKQ